MANFAGFSQPGAPVIRCWSTTRPIPATSSPRRHTAATTSSSRTGRSAALVLSRSALYRYFGSRDDLLTALILDAFDDPTAVLQTAHQQIRDCVPAVEGGEAFVAVACAYRGWALAHPIHYRLIFGNPVGGYSGTDQTSAASLRSTRVLLDVMVDLVQAGLLDTERVGRDLTPSAHDRYALWASELNDGLEPPALAAAITCYSALHGAIGLEMNRHLPRPLPGVDDVFTAIMRLTVAGVLRSASSTSRGVAAPHLPKPDVPTS